MSIPLNLYQCHQCGEQWSAQGLLFQNDGCVNCGLKCISPAENVFLDDPDIVELERLNSEQNFSETSDVSACEIEFDNVDNEQ